MFLKPCDIMDKIAKFAIFLLSGIFSKADDYSWGRGELEGSPCGVQAAKRLSMVRVLVEREGSKPSEWVQGGAIAP